MKLLNLKQSASFLAILTAVGMSAQKTAEAQTVSVDPTQPSSTLIDSTQSGVPIIHIDAPNDSGVSHNLFTDFNVGQQGLILNNSSEVATSQLGGQIFANPNLIGGSEANLIISEVTGGNRSQLSGITEIHGGAADYVLANA